MEKKSPYLDSSNWVAGGIVLLAIGLAYLALYGLLGLVGFFVVKLLGRYVQ